jgi:iron-sulfur cluster assembly protein
MIQITPAAAEYIKIKLAERQTPEAYVRLGVKGGMCAGFAYVIEYDDNPPKEKDTIFEFDGVKVVVDKKSLLFLDGIILDAEKNLMRRGLKIVNPREDKRCGCGASFSVK